MEQIIQQKNQIIAALQRENDELKALLQSSHTPEPATLLPGEVILPRNVLATIELGPEGDLNH